MSPLIQADELARVLGSVTVLDVRWRLGGPPGRAEHEAGHVPGASYVDLDESLAGPPGPEGRHPLPDPGDFARAMRAAGVSASRPVVVYDDWGGRAAARCRWLLRAGGHRDVRVLDGGWAAWRAAGGEVETGRVRPERGDLVAVSRFGPVADVADVPLARPLLDARAPERFRGETEPVDPVAGHIPGAVNVPTEASLDDDGRFRSPAELATTYAGLDGAVVYCGSGITACHTLLALELVGLEGTLFPGGWSGWVADRGRPVATGS